MPRTEEANQRIREKQRTAILDAALSVFARKGMEATIADVADVADVSYGLVYRYFASKEALLGELVEKVLRDSLSALEQVLELPGMPGERLCSLLTQIVQSVREHPEFILLAQQMLDEEVAREHAVKPGQKPDQVSKLSKKLELRHETLYGQLHKLIQEQLQTYQRVLKQLIVEGQATGEIAYDDPDQLVAAITAFITGLSRSAIWQTPEQFQRTFPDVAILLRMFVSQQKEKKDI